MTDKIAALVGEILWVFRTIASAAGIHWRKPTR